jgi:Ca2+-binding EF-hand superfamily protein
MHQDVAITIFSKIFKKIDKNWIDFISDLKSKANADDQSQITFQDFVLTLHQYNVILTESEKQKILSSFPGHENPG